MARIRPFKALRPKKEEVAKVASPPYDVLGRTEAKELTKDNPISFLHVVKAEIDLPDGIDTYDDRVYEKSRENLNILINEGHLIGEDSPSFYLYTQGIGAHIQNGLVCLASVDEYDKDQIKKHELTRKAKEEDRTRHIDILNAQTGPVFLSYRDDDSTAGLHDIYERIRKRESLYKFEGDGGVLHTVWRIDDAKEIEEIQNIIKRAESLYIADGHHRSKSASLVREVRRKGNPNHTGREEYNYFLSVIFPHTELKIMAYNRVVKDLNGLNKKEFIDRIGKDFIIEEVSGRYEPEAKHHFGMYLDGRWFHLIAREGTFLKDDVVGSIDASILQANLLNPILSIKKPKQSDRIDFVGGIKGLEGLLYLIDSGKFALAFALYPTSMEELMSVADEGLNMPPKSTWFEPKLRSGLFVHQL